MADASRMWPPPLPREHGAWAMLLTPVVAAVIAHGPHWQGVTAVLGWVAAYCLRGPMELLLGGGPTGRAGMARGSRPAAVRWLALMGLAALLPLGRTIWLRPLTLVPLLVAAGMLAAVQRLSSRGQTRSVWAGLLSVTGLMAGAPLYCLAAGGRISGDGWAVTLACFAFFAGSVFRVKSVARERQSVPFRHLSVALHLAAVLTAGLAVIWLRAPALLPVALLPSAWWALRCARVRGPIHLGRVGKSEVWLTLSFVSLLVVAVRI